MKPPIYQNPLVQAAAALLLALGLWLWLRDAQPSEKDLQTMQTYTQNMKTLCVGRFLIDVPNSVTDATGSYETQIASVKLLKTTKRPVVDELYLLDQELAERAATLKTQQTLTHKPRYYGRFAPGPNIRSLHYIPPDSGDDKPKLAGYVVRDGGVFYFSGTAYDEEDIKEFHDFLLDIEPKLSVRDDRTIPTTPGFCIDGGLVALNPKRGENVNGWGWHLPGHPDVYFGLGTTTNDNTIGPGILDREPSTVRQAGPDVMKHVRNLRKQRYEVAGMKIQEWLVETTDDTANYMFKAEIQGLPNDNAHPQISLGMEVGGYGEGGYHPPTLTTGEALALWDAVIKTLRPRPGAF